MFSGMCDIFCVHYCALTPFHDNALVFAAKVRMHSHFRPFSMHSFDTLAGYHFGIS